MNTYSTIFIFILFSISGEIFGQMKGGYSNMDKESEEFGDLMTELQESDMDDVLNNATAVMVKSVEEAQQQVVAGMNYRILSEVEVDGQSKKCCFQAFRSLDGDFSVNCADCACNYPSSECFNQ